MCEVVPAWFYYGPLHLCWLMAVGPFNTWHITSSGIDKMTTVFTQNDNFDNFEWSKGQLISKGLFGILNSSKKQMKKKSINLFLFIFWKNLKTPKRHFEINFQKSYCPDISTVPGIIWIDSYTFFSLDNNPGHHPQKYPTHKTYVCKNIS